MYIIANGETYQSVRMLDAADSVTFLGSSLPAAQTVTGDIKVYANNGFEMRTVSTADYARQELTSGAWTLTNAPEPQPVVVTPVTYDLTQSTANAVRLLMAGKQPETADEIIQCSALYPEWVEGKHETGEIFLLDGAPWKVLAAYDNAEHPDIAPGETAWATFNIPYHGTTRETARAWVKPNNATDIYKVGEWCVFDGKYYVSKRGTNFSPTEYPADWEEQE